jgi:hypothetical protein
MEKNLVPYDVKEEENAKVEEILVCIKEKFGIEYLTSKEVFLLIFKILDTEFNTPRTHKENNMRDKYLVKVINSILIQHYSQDTTMGIVAKLGESALKRIENKEQNNYVT